MGGVKHMSDLFEVIAGKKLHTGADAVVFGQIMPKPFAHIKGELLFKSIKDLRRDMPER